MNDYEKNLMYIKENEMYAKEDEKIYEWYCEIKKCSILIYLFIGLTVYSLFTINSLNDCINFIAIFFSIIVIISLILSQIEFRSLINNCINIITFFSFFKVNYITPIYNQNSKNLNTIINNIFEYPDANFIATYSDMKIHVSIKINDNNIKKDVIIYTHLNEFLNDFTI